MQILSNGYKLPETGDFGSTWFPALEDNITRLNGHTHDGTNSSKLSSVNITNFVQNVDAAAFIVDGSTFSATVTVTGLLIDNAEIVVRNRTTKDRIFLNVEKLANNQFKIYSDYAEDVEVMVV